MKSIIAVAIACLMLAGCASKNDVSMMNSYYTANNVHNQEQSKQVASKAGAIKDAVVISCNESEPNCAVAKAMSGVVSAMFISGIEAQEFTTAAPKTGISVQTEFLKTVAGGIPFVTIGWVAHDGLKAAGDKIEGSTVAGNDYTTTETTITEVPVEEEEPSVPTDPAL